MKTIWLASLCGAAVCTAQSAHAAGVDPIVAAEAPADAERCLATAIYYEAAREPVAGREAVAQVILNRRASPHYPKTICGVVYQGSSRRSGCQFSFTCDGSTARLPEPRRFAEAAKIARRALAGGIASAVGNALNYHASYVAPAWGRALVREATIGLHVFYQAPGGGRANLSPGGIVTMAASGAARPLSVWGIPLAAIRASQAAPLPTEQELAASRQLALADPGQVAAQN